MRTLIKINDVKNEGKDAENVVKARLRGIRASEQPLAP